MGRDLAKRMNSAVQRVLPAGLVARTNLIDRDALVYAVVVEGAGASHTFNAGWAGDGWPADVKRLMALGAEIDVVVASELSVGSREWLAGHNVGWIAESGRANVMLPTGLVLVREEPMLPSTPGQYRRDRWSPATIAAAEAIITGVEPRVRAIQDATGYSRGAVAQSLSRLADAGLVAGEIARGPASGRHVTDPARLLDEYADAVAYVRDRTPHILLHGLWADPVQALSNDIAPALDQADVAWAATGRVAGDLMAPYLSRVSIIELFVSGDLFNDPERLAEVLQARVVDTGHRAEVWPMPSIVTAGAGETVNGVRCAPAARVYADLRALGGRAAEAAQHLREVLHVGTGP